MARIPRPLVELAAAALCCAAVSAGCGPIGASGDRPDRTAVQRLLDGRAAALLDRDEQAYLAGAVPARRAAERQVFRNLADVPLASWSYRVVSVDGGDRPSARVELDYRVKGYDSAPVAAQESVRLGRGGDGRWRVAAEGADGDQLWEQGPVRVVRGTYSLVLGTVGTASLKSYAADADRAVPAVLRAWGTRGWSGRIVVEVPASLRSMGELLDAPADAYQGIAAVTTGEAGGPASDAPGGRVIVNPEAFGELSAFGRRVVLTHEATHVATRSATAPGTPLWLSEGFADWVAYRGTGRSAPDVAPELARDVAAGRVPRALPSDADFGTRAAGLAQAYEGAWLACRFIAEQWGDARLVALYRAGADTRRVLGIGTDELTARWRAYVERELG
ncbi:hypothetical protein ACFYXS_24060 [Streptomyces sp. NPDC002574]|uniref:hypothetical protein n=1 Tax=Streptomyces sp. NPDC002574 TaxID=3364652 RepID=UPI003682ED4D